MPSPGAQVCLFPNCANLGVPLHAELELENRRLRKRAERAEALVEVQKKLSELLGVELPASDEQP